MNTVAKIPTHLSAATENEKSKSSFRECFLPWYNGFLWLVGLVCAFWFGFVVFYFGFSVRSWQSADLWCLSIHANFEKAVFLTNR